MTETEATIKILDKIATRVDWAIESSSKSDGFKPFWKIIGPGYTLAIQQHYSKRREKWGFIVHDFDGRFAGSGFFHGLDMLERMVELYPQTNRLLAEPINND